MQDSRFTTLVENVDELLVAVDVDALGDVETLLMVLLARPVDVVEEGAGLDLMVHGSEYKVGWVEEFPMSVCELARSCVEVADDLGPWPDAPVEGLHASADDDELVTALQGALGQVRLLGMFGD